MSRRATQVCRVCRVAVRPDRLLDHLERVHPSTLTEEEREALHALHAERTNPAVWREPEPPVDIVDDDLPDEEEAAEDRVDRARSPSRDFRAGSLESRADAVLGILSDRCLEPFEGNRKYDQQQWFEEECRRRWRELADSDPALVDARERLFEADLPKFTREYEAGFQDRQAALEVPLATLREAGERGVPHLGTALMTDSWASALAAENLVKMPRGPLRDRALVEALFVAGDWGRRLGSVRCPASRLRRGGRISRTWREPPNGPASNSSRSTGQRCSKRGRIPGTRGDHRVTWAGRCSSYTTCVIIPRWFPGLSSCSILGSTESTALRPSSMIPG